MRKSVLLALAGLALLLAVLAVPAEAKIFCWNCTCANPCSQLCYNGSSWETCAAYLCASDCGPLPVAPPRVGGDELALFDGDVVPADQCSPVPTARATPATPVEATAPASAD